MTGHEMYVEIAEGVHQFRCECGYVEKLPTTCTFKLVACLHEAHKAAVLIRAMESLGVGQPQEVR